MLHVSTTTSNIKLLTRLQLIVRRLAPYLILSLIVFVLYGVYVREQEKDTVRQLEASFNEQQAIQVGLASRSIEDHFNAQLNQIDLVATSLADYDTNNVSEMSLSEVLIPSLLQDRFDEYLAWGFIFLESPQPSLHTSYHFPDHRNEDDLPRHEHALELLNQWLADYSSEVYDSHYPYVTDVAATSDVQIYGILYPITDPESEQVIGIIGVAVDFSIPLELYVVPVRSGEFGAAWIQDHRGIVIYDHETEIIGQSVWDLHVNYPALLELDEGYLTNYTDRGEYSFTVQRGGEVRRKLVAWDTIELANLHMTLALSAPDTEISSFLVTSRQRDQIVAILLVAVFALGGGFIFFFQQGALQRLVAERTRELATERELLKEQVREREHAENLVRKSNELLEQRVYERTAELTAANERLEDLDRLKTKFVSDVSHELRTPIASLIINLDLMEKDSPDRQAGYLEKIKVQANQVAVLVKDILNLAKLDRDVLNKADVLPLNDIVEQAIAVHQPLATVKGLSINFEAYQDTVEVCCSKIQLIQVITNLLGNAIHYTESGGIHIKTLANDDNVGLIIKDTGRGIDDEDLPYVFDRFYRGKAVSMSNVPGTGLGLDIVKEIVERFEGTIEVSSKVGEGSEFRVWFPLVKKEDNG